MKRFFLALSFLTLLPLREEKDVRPEDLRGSIGYFPIVGALLGILFAGACYLASFAFGHALSSIIAILVLAFSSGALHLDGLIDTIDGLAGGRSPKERLRIMRDSSIGAVGAAFLGIFLLIKFSAVEEALGVGALGLVFLAPVAGRWAIAPMAYLGEYARREGGTGLSFVGCSIWTLVLSGAITAILSFALLGFAGLMLMIGIGLYAAYLTRFFAKRLSGVTGDVFGFLCETSEALFVVAGIAVLKFCPQLAATGFLCSQAQKLIG